METPKAPYALPAKQKAAKVPKAQKPGKPSKYNKNKIQPVQPQQPQQFTPPRFSSPTFSTQQHNNQPYGAQQRSQVRCDQTRCPHYLTVKSKGVNGDYSNVDWDHLHDEHLRTWAEFGWHKMKQYERELNNRAEVVSEQPTKKDSVQIETKIEVLALTADPRNHVHGICDALIEVGNGVFKCTDAVRHGKNVCVVHMNHTQCVGRLDMAEPKISVEEPDTDQPVISTELPDQTVEMPLITDI